MTDDKCSDVSGRTSLALLYLEGEVEGSDGEVDGLGVHGPHLTQQVQDESTFVTHQTCQQLGDPTTHTRHVSSWGILQHTPDTSAAEGSYNTHQTRQQLRDPTTHTRHVSSWGILQHTPDTSAAGGSYKHTPDTSAAGGSYNTHQTRQQLGDPTNTHQTRQQLGDPTTHTRHVSS